MYLEQVQEQISGCTRCPLHENRTQIVFGVGNPKADIMFVGEAPGANEDAQGEPFVGNAGRLLDRLLEKAGLTRADVYITNVIKCRPPHNRDPRVTEIRECRPFLALQVEAIQPRVVVTLGKYASWYVTGVFGSMGSILETEGLTCSLGAPVPESASVPAPVVPLYHPSYLLRQGGGDRAKVIFQGTLRRLLEAKRLAGTR